jgi:hypothetical protein
MWAEQKLTQPFLNWQGFCTFPPTKPPRIIIRAKGGEEMNDWKGIIVGPEMEATT